MAKLQDVRLHTSPADVVYLSNDRSMSCNLYRQYTRLLKLLCVAALSPLISLIFYVFTPTSVLIAVASFVNDLFWIHFKSISLETCNTKCPLVAFSMIVSLLSGVMAVVFSIVAIPLTVQFRNQQVVALRRGLAPFGKTSDGAVKPLPSAGSAALVAIGCIALLSAILLPFSYGLYDSAGSDQTIHPKTGREFSMAFVVMINAIFMGTVQFCATFLSSFATLLFLNLRSLLKI